MKIKSKFQIITVLSIVIGLLIAFTLFINIQDMRAAMEEDGKVDQMTSGVFELNLLTNDYLSNRTERTQIQWQLRYDSLSELIHNMKFRIKEEQLLQKEILHNHDYLKVIFSRIIANYASRKNSNEMPAESSELEERLVGKLLTNSQTMVSSAKQLIEISHRGLVSAQRKSSLVVILLVILITAIIAANSFFTRKSIIVPISKLQKGTQTIGEGDLNFKIASVAKDEIGDLSRAFDHMTEKLKAITVSRDELEDEIKERKQAEEEKKKLEDQLQQAQKLESVGILAGGLAHDFNNLLSIIMGNISMTKDDVKPEYGVTEFLNEAEEASLRAQELANQLITFSKGGAPVKKTGPIGDMVKKTTDFALSDSNVKCEFFISSDLYAVEFDQGQMKHAVKNIIDNAVESMQDGGSIAVKAENIKISSETIEKSLPIPEGKYVKISIRDHGVGIPEEHLSMVFDPYFSTKKMGTQKGMGLGLATTYSIINRHDGHITVESEVGVGTTFTLYLPAHEKDVRELEPIEITKPERPEISTGRILLMDDEKSIRKVTKQMLSRLGYDPDFAKDGTEAIELYQEAIESGKPFEAVILDLTIKGGMGGVDTIKKLMEIDPQIRAIVSSGYSNDPVMTDFRKYGFIGALAKPYTKKGLGDMLNNVIV